MKHTVKEECTQEKCDVAEQESVPPVQIGITQPGDDELQDPGIPGIPAGISPANQMPPTSKTVSQAKTIA